MTQPQVVRALLFSVKEGFFTESSYHICGQSTLFFSPVDSSGFIATLNKSAPFCCSSMMIPELFVNKYAVGGGRFCITWPVANLLPLFFGVRHNAKH